MRIDVCTLFEGGYHRGLAVLANSLHANGFEGRIFAGHREALPAWADGHEADAALGWAGARRLAVGGGPALHFLPVETASHFTNHKPDFMLSVLDGPGADADGVLYLDPDLFLDWPWSYVLEWMECGVALCEDVNSPVSANHPRRAGWRRHFGTSAERVTERYVNGGCVGVLREQRRFPEVWRELQRRMFAVTGGGERVGIGSTKGGHTERGFAECFDKTDQDALNAAVERCAEVEVSILGKEAMAFAPGRCVLPHALGRDKPWDRPFLSMALNCRRGRAVRLVDRLYWTKYAEGPLRPHTGPTIRRKRWALAVASAIGRFYRKQ